jgi:uncharacterized membrane protein
MDNQALQKIGKELNISDKDIKDIRKAGFTSKILYWIITAIIAIISFIIGFLVGRGTLIPSGGGPSGGYPFAGGLVIPSALSGKKRSSKIAILLTSATAFLIAIKVYPVFGQATLYNVYRK